MSVIPPQVNVINAPGQERVGTIAQPYPGQPGPMPEIGETLRVRNVDDRVLRFAWNSRQYVIAPGEEDFMPFDGVKVYTGDPRATNVVRTMKDPIGIISFLPDRATEVRRLRLLYAAPFGEYMSSGDIGGIFVHTPESQPNPLHAWDGVRIPKVEIYNIRNERIYTVLDDPEGTLNIPVSVTQADQNRTDQLMAVVQRQQTVIDAMAERLGIDPNGPAVDNQPDLLNERPPEDQSEPEGEVHEDGSPKMVYDQREDRVKQKRRPTPTDPTTFDDLPEDKCG